MSFHPSLGPSTVRRAARLTDRIADPTDPQPGEQRHVAVRPPTPTPAGPHLARALEQRARVRCGLGAALRARTAQPPRDAARPRESHRNSRWSGARSAPERCPRRRAVPPPLAHSLRTRAGGGTRAESASGEGWGNVRACQHRRFERRSRLTMLHSRAHRENSVTQPHSRQRPRSPHRSSPTHLCGGNGRAPAEERPYQRAATRRRSPRGEEKST